MKHLTAAFAGLGACLLLMSPPAKAAEATFTRDLTVTDKVDLTVNTGSGTIHLTKSSDGHIHVFARVRGGWGADESQVNDIAAHPPIEQTGNIVRIGTRHMNLHNISIDYDIQAPAGAFLDASSGSGSVNDDGVGVNAHLNTGSGSIHATALQGGFSVGTGSGNIYAEQTGTGDVKASTGSGSIELKNLHGGLRAETGSGSIKVTGVPAEGWRLNTGSGSIEIWTGDAPFTVDAGSGSGSVHSDREVLTVGTMEHHHLRGKIAGGGPTVRLNTGSGSIRIH